MIKKEPDGKCLFRALSRGWFGSNEYQVEVKESLCDYVLNNSIRFEHHIPTVLSEYISKMLEYVEWSGESEIVVFLELYYINIYVYDTMASLVSYLVAENPTTNHSVYLFFINSNHFDTLMPKVKFKNFILFKNKEKDCK